MADKSAAAAAGGTPRGGGDKFEARRTSRVSKDFAKADGDVWQENLAVCESVGNKLLIRSYYLNKRTKKRVWDEPPSGASKLIPATEDMRRMANLQMQEMQLVLGVFPEDTKNNKKGASGGLFRWKGGKSGTNGGPKPSNNRITYKPGSALAPKPEAVRDDTMDPDIQKAISMSLGGKYDHPSSSSEPKIRAEIWQEEEDDEVAMARALSLSAAEANGSSAAAALSHGTADAKRRHSPRRDETEEEILARVLEQSRLDAKSKSSEEEKREEDADLGVGGGSSHLGHTIASNGGSRSPNRKSLSPRREDGSRQSASQKHDERKPSSLSPNREESKLSASQRRSSRNIKDASNSDKVSESSRRKSSVSPKRASSMKNAAAEAAAAAAAEEEEQMLQLALEASLREAREAERISQAQQRISEVSQRGRRTISLDDDLDHANRIPEPSQRGRRSISDHEASLESHRVSQLQDRLSQRGNRTISPMRDSNHSHNSLRNSNHTSSSEHRRRSHEWNHSSPKQQLGHSSEHRRRSVNEILNSGIPYSSSPKHDGYTSEHRRRSVDDILLHTSSSPKLDRHSDHRLSSVQESKHPPNFSVPKRDLSEHRSHSVHDINLALRHGVPDSHSPRASYSPKGSPKHEAEYSASSRGSRSSYSAGAEHTSWGTRSSYSADAEYTASSRAARSSFSAGPEYTSRGTRSSHSADAEYTSSSRGARSSYSADAEYTASSRGARSSYSAGPEYTSRGTRSSYSADAEYTTSSRGTRSSYHAGTSREDMPSLITNSSSGEGICKSGSSEKTASSERAIKGVRSSESDGLHKLEEVPSNGRRKSRASSSRKLNGIHDAGIV